MASKKKSSALLFSIGGIITVAVILILLNYIFGAFRARIDLTEDNLYTLSDGTRKILSEVDTPVKIRYYVTQDKKVLPQYLQTYIPKVEDLLTEYEKRSNDGLVEVERMNPEPDSDDEIAANQAGISAATSPSGYAIYNGIEVQSLDQKAIIPFLDPREEKTLEYELSRAITEVSRSEKPEIWVMTEQSLTGQPINPMMAMQGGGGQQPPWFLYQTLQRDYDVKTVGVATDVIDSSVDLLMVLHPNGITETAEYAIDQYLLGGGKVIAMLDPNFYMGGGANPMGGGATTTSTFSKLLSAWGIEFSDGQAVADLKYRTALQGQRGQRELEPRVLSLNAEAVNEDDISTNALQSMMYIFGGAFSGT
ncbi:MAG: GldG family protein, partial [Verrucomicrobiota bacterium]